MISQKYSLEHSAITAFTRKQLWNEKEVNLPGEHKQKTHCYLAL